MKHSMVIGLCLSISLLGMGGSSAWAVTLGISADGKYFTIDGEPTFLLGVSYYGAQSITTANYRTQDLDDMQARGFNWIRAWARWYNVDDGTDYAVVEKNGTVREPYMTRLKTLITECNNRGMIVDVTMSRSRVDTDQQLMDVWMTLTNHLLPYRNVYFDLANESDIANRFLSYPYMGQIVTAIRAIDPTRLCTASRVPTDAEDLENFYRIGKGDFTCPHLCRNQGCSAQTLATVKQYITWMNQRSFRIPVHMQEPFNRDYEHTSYNPQPTDYYRDCGGAKLAEAGGWCLHNGAWAPYPYRSFDMRDAYGRLFTQFDSVETTAAANVFTQIGGIDLMVRLYQPEYDEQISKQIGRTDGSARSANVAQDAAGYLTYGPYLNTLPADTYQVSWRMAIDNNTSDNNTVVTLDIRDSTVGVIRASRAVTRQEFAAANVYQDFTLTLTYANPGNSLEFRTYWHDNSYLKLDYIDVRPQKAPVICEVSPDPDPVYTGSEYVRQLSFCNSPSPAPTWSVISGPSGVQVDGSGRVYGWMPMAAGTFTIVVRASNIMGSDDESWQVQVQALPAGTIAMFPFNSGSEGWTLATWKAGQYDLGTMTWDSTNGHPGGNVRSTGSGSTNGTDSCTREGGLMSKAISTANYEDIHITYDVIAALNTPPSSGCTGNCTSTILEGSCEDKLAVYYSTTGASGPWTLAQVLTEGVDLPSTWTSKLIDLSGVPATRDNANFALQFKWQFNTATDTGRIDNVKILGSPIGGLPPAKASNPNPAHQSTGVDRNANLSWTAGDGVVSHDVYFGTTNPPAFQVNQTGTIFDPGLMVRAQTYYWRIDERNDTTVTIGDVWQFTVQAAQGDFDADGDVDLTDFGYLQRCFSGSGVPPASGCTNADLGGDNDVDQADFDLFKACFGGADGPPGC